MTIVHVKSNAIADFTGTITGFNSQGSTTTIAATNLVRPSDWNSQHNQLYTLAGNTTNASTVSGTNVPIHATGGISIGGSNGSIIISAPAPETATMWFPFNEAVNVVGQMGQGVMQIVPLPGPRAADVLHADRVAFPVHFSNSSNSTGSATLSMWMGMYTKTASTLSLLYSTSGTVGVSYNGSASSASNHGIRLVTFPWTTTIDANARYYVAVASRTTTAGTNASWSQVLMSQMNSVFSGMFGVASNASAQWPLGYGSYSATTSGIPSSIGISQIQGSASLAARPPSWFMLSDTV